MARCVHCAKPIARDEDICPLCGGEQPAGWAVNLVHVLEFLFVQGLVYRIILPNDVSLWRYSLYFLATSTLVFSAWFLWKRFKGSAFSGHGDRHETD